MGDLVSLRLLTFQAHNSAGMHSVVGHDLRSFDLLHCGILLEVGVLFSVAEICTNDLIGSVDALALGLVTGGFGLG